MAPTAGHGFAGSVTAQSVADLLQFNGSTRFSGSIAVSYQEQEAVIYMVHGEVVHAECGGLRGEGVLGVVMGWPTGNFETHANVATFARTIDKRLDHLLLDAARHLDEARRESPGMPRPAPQAHPVATPATPLPATTPPPGSSPAPVSGPAMPWAAERTRSVAGVTYATVVRGGAPVGDPSPAAVALASRSTFLLAMLANPLGKALGLGEVSRAALSSGPAGQLLLLQAKEAYLAVSLEPEVSVADAEAAIRRAVMPRQGA